jgi:predicted porin
MKKSFLVMLALAGASDVVYAQSSVTIYGVVDEALVYERNAVANAANTAAGIARGSSIAKLTSGVYAGSRIGFKGSEDLGGGLAAIFTLESGFQADTGAMGQGGLLFGRQSFVGLTDARLGTVKVGRQYTSFDSATSGSDPFNKGTAGSIGNLFGATYVANTNAYYTSRVNNDVVYALPNINGVTGDVAYGFGEVAGSTASSRYAGASLGYENGPLWLRAAHNNTNNATATGAAKNTMLGAVYNFGVFKLHGALSVNKTTAASATTVDSRDYMVGVTVPFGGVQKILASYIKKKDRLADGKDASQIGVGYVYSLSKRTDLYTAYAHIVNKNGAGYTVGSSIESGTGTSAFNLGVRHMF